MCLFFLHLPFSLHLTRSPLGLPRCIYNCQKWIPDKILHRYDNSFFSQLFFFRKKKTHFENEKIFVFVKILTVYKGKFVFPKGNLKCVEIFSTALFKMIFHDEKIKVEKKTGV